ncbi:MAG: ABC transporter ATP-binding protein [Ectothiorhodospiraceae bacterium]|nr:ABC transporter ATP-binding protein [Ectothiorhodospiraceae bacterium]
MIRLRGLDKCYREGDRDRVVLRDFSLDVAEGQRLALVGRSGSGKSTLLNLISGMDAPDAGGISVGGIRVDQLGERDRTLFRRRHIGFVFQFFNLIPTLTVRENLMLPLQLLGRTGALAGAPAMELLAQVGLADRGDSFPEQLSGGEQQRVAIARALIHRPRVLLADEPTGTLDEETGALVLTLLDELTAAHGMTVVMVTHSPEVAARMDRVIRLVDGRPVEV